MRTLAEGEEKEFKSYPKLFKEKFIFLNEYTTSVAAEHDPRGPEGPYQFVDKSVPVVVIKSWEGKTLLQQLGFTPDLKQGPQRLAQLIDKAVKEHGPVVPPKALRPLLKLQESAQKATDKKRYSAAIKDLRKLIEMGEDKKEFPEGPPDVAAQAAKSLEALRQQCEERMAEVAEQAKTEPKKAKTAYYRLIKDFGGFPELKEEMKAAMEAL